MTVTLSKLLQWLVLALLFPLIFINGWLALRVFKYFQPLVTIFVLAILLAFILNYPVEILQKRGLKRSHAVLWIFLPTLVLLVALGITLLPIILEQFNECVKLFPQWIDATSNQLKNLDNWALSRGFPIQISHLVAQLTDRLPGELQFFANKIIKLTLETIDSISEALLTLVLTFYILLDGERLWRGIFQRLPSSYRSQIQMSLQQNFQNYFIGQFTLALLVGFSMTLLFLILNVHLGLLFGLAIGIMTLIPFGDVLSLSVITLLIASHDFWLGVKVLVSATVVDQLIDQAIAPRLLGSFTGLRPVWVLVSLLVGTYVGGLLGLLVAVPLAGFIKDAADGWQMATAETAISAVDLATLHANGSDPQVSPEILTKESSESPNS